MRSARTRRYLAAIGVATALALPLTSLDASASASTAISARAFGMHYVNPSDPYPALPFGTARIWDDGVTWRDLQPQKGTTNAAVLARLDNLVATFRAHGAQPMITLGMTPAWAAHRCNHYYRGVNWGLQTCAPVSTSTTGSWGSYVRFLAKRYRGKVQYFELWNEPSLHNGYNDSPRTLAKMQVSAQKIVHAYGAKLVSPGIGFTDGNPKHGLSWLDAFLHYPGGKSFDIVGFHLYAADAPAKAGYGPEWAISTLGSARSVLRSNGIGGRPIWNTETNVGRVPAHIQFSGTRGAGMVARTYLLATENNVARTIWYAADDRHWGGTWLENSDFKTLAAPGHAYVTVRNLLVGAHPRGCTQTKVGTNRWHYACRYHLASGKNMIAVWSTGGTFTYHGPRGTKRFDWVTGGGRAASHATKLTVGVAPVYVIGTFKV